MAEAPAFTRNFLSHVFELPMTRIDRSILLNLLRPLVVRMLLPIVLVCFATISEGQLPTDPLLDQEVKTVRPEMMRKWASMKDRSSESPTALTTPKLIRIVYLVPSDKILRTDYRDAIRDSTLHLQSFYQSQLGNGSRFSLSTPIVDVYKTSHPAAYYSSVPSAPGAPFDQWFWENVLNDGFELTGGGLVDPNNRWIFYIDADTACGQKIGGKQ